MTESKRTLLIVEDDPGVQKQLRWCFSQEYEVVLAENAEAAVSALRRHVPEVVTLDLGLPPDPANASEGLRLLGELLSLAPETKIIVVTGNDDRENAVRAVGMGAFDFYQKPIDPEVLGLIVRRASFVHQLEAENRQLLRQQSSGALDGIIACSPEMLRVCRMIEKIAPADVTTLLLGDSGTGKELLAKALHNLSSRSKQRFVAINCAAIPENLLESELFGYEKGAFTGATRQTKGKVEYASSGTLFLDEVGDLPMSLQAKLLRFLQERVIERVGGREEIPVDVRVICATHRDLEDLIGAGSFREDLFYRISEMTVRIPGLAERIGDAVLLARAFLDRFARQNGRNLRGFTQDALDAIEGYHWPGNVRELENRVKRAAIMTDGPQVTADDLELQGGHDGAEPLNLREAREEAERRAVLRALSKANYNVSRAAEMLGVTRPTLYNLKDKYQIELKV